MIDRLERLPEIESLYRTFAAHAARTPHAVAITDGPEQISYAQLNRAAAEYRYGLRECGVQAGELVGIGLSRGWEVVAAILAVLSHGCGYVPLDPAYPRERLRFMTEDSGIRTVITDETAAGLLPGELSRVHRVPGAGQLEPPATRLADTPAYVIYTSGSTGVPKGVPVPESAVLALFSACINGPFAFGPDDAWSHFFSDCFDFAVWEMWGALLFGGRLVIVPAKAARNPAAFLDLLAHERITVLNQVPSFFKHLVRAYERTAVELALRYVIFGGEPLDRVSVRRWMQLRPDAEALVNMYGITETTVHVTYGRLKAEHVAEDTGGTWIGRPLRHLKLALLDARGVEVPVGDVGEIQVAGAGVAGAYLGRPELTAERFRRLDLDGVERVWYRTGDLARQRPDGSYEYLGRDDRQVNLRGFRIELGEVEAVLRSHAHVVDAVAAVEDALPRESLLVAYIVTADSVNASEQLHQELLDHCAAQLPVHMVPGQLVTLPGMPLTASGKLDRARLRAFLGATGGSSAQASAQDR
ncbi:amino acid adenylation domain-containing protein [Nocardiopsis sp. NPDC006198]|uniref:amino acid adenylation domain-containing protein n=1 Tax=Nocardiopsis sp. NPDC006198 TaxID=3154472 RepID=UPI0033B847D8